ncbi:MAG: alpha/beta hydrolase [Ruminococcaceae bacterium]|nr:alpha/beta hydrolase [Oscillospiraceae bacterium]
MKKSVKAVTGAAVSTAALLGIFCTATYECMLNIRLAGKIGERFSPAVNELPEEEKNEVLEKENEREREAAAFQEKVSEWHSCHSATDLYLTNEKGQKRHAKFFNNGHPERWAIIFHGFTSAPGGMYHYAYPYALMGFNCILPSMIGHGQDENRYCSMGYHDRYMGVDWIDYIVTMYPDAEIVLHGESMGAATTMLITGEVLPDNVKCAISDCGFTSVMEEYTYVAKNQMTSAMVPLLHLLSLYSEMRGNFGFKKCAPVEAVKKSKTPTLFVHGECDDFVPFRMMHEVYGACSAEKEYFTVKSAAHAESSTKEPKLYWTNVYEFIKKHIEL